uniref:Uncharacterized protein n=1 Tax=Panagrolaimus sp. ES5 TaxID=591445 RepID=A0AC34FPT2_9BILA
MRWLDNVVDLDFFNIVVVGQCLGYSNKLSTFGEDFAHDMDSLFFRLSGGFSNLFPVDYFSQPNPTKDRSKSMQILALWALCLNQVEVVKCIWAHSPEPMPLALVMSRIAKSLAFEGREYFFYEERLKILAHYLTNAACNLLDEAYKSAPKPAYLTLCQKLSNFNRLTMTRLAYETNNREFISHECCQRWVLRLFYSNLKIGQIVNGISLPRWLKILLSAVFVVPIWIWISVGPSSSEFSGHDLPHNEQPKSQISPTVALLQNGQPKKRVRAASTYSMHSGRSYGLHRDDTAAPSRDERTFGTETPRSGIAPSLHVGGNDEVEAMLPQEDRKFRSSLDIPSRRKGVRRKATRASLGDFYSAPIVKYWLSLTFRVLYLCFFAYSIALPGCGNAWFDYALWLWTLMWLLESIWVIYLRCRDTNISQLRWTLFDVISVSLFLIALITFESAGRLMIKYVSFPSAYLVKVIWSCLLLYQCYATLFIYIPLSDLLGPLLVRVKLMVTRDFVYFFILVSLAVCSTAIAVKAIVYPDLELTIGVIRHHISWAWMQLFTTDLKALEQTEKCRATFLAPRSRDYCTHVGGFANHECPADSQATYFVIVEYLIVLKLICWPLLFALFAKTAKEVDDEADKIWKYQLYGLATDFSLRPCLPPPFTPLFFLGVTCCQLSSCACGFFNKVSFTSSDHPDVIHHSRNDTSLLLSPSKVSVVYRNPSVPNQKIGTTKHFYCKAALNYWKSNIINTDSKLERRLSAFTKSLNEKVHHLIVSTNFSGIAAQSDERKIWSAGDPDESKRVIVNEKYRSWHVLIPDYCPPNYSKPIQDFSQELQKFVDQTSPNHLAELCKQWRQKKLHDLLKEKSTDLQLSTVGLPLNPSGRTGLSGRGNLVKFGPNNLQFYVIITRTSAQQLMILTTPDNDLPNKQRYDYNRADEYLHNILTTINVPDPSAQIYSTKGHLTTGQIDNCVLHVCTQPLSSNEDTDNAWTEADVWAVNLTEPIDYLIQMSPNGFKWQPANYLFSQKLRNDFVKQSLRAFKLQT